MKILVTGGSGYVGSLLVPKLLKLNYQVLVIDTFWYGDFLKKHKNLKKVKKNILDLEKKDLKNIDGVIHLAGIANDTSSDLIPKLTWEITCLGTKILCDLCKENKVKFFIYASSSSVYGVKKEKKVHEELSCKPISDYNKTKLVTEKIIQGYDKYFKNFLIRPATLYGEAPKMRLDLTLNILTEQAAKKKVINVHGGEQYRPYLHVNDMVDLYIFLIKKYKKIKSGPYNASSGNMKVIDKAKLISKINNKVKIKIKKIIDIRSYRVDSSKLNKIGFFPKENLEEALLRMYNLFKNNKIKNKPQFYSIYWIKKLGLAK
jgi:nucleoside-diphosphate-sugar epimerase